ncbi:MAG: TolC family protein, partial [Planctomycetia bacterium]
MIRPSALLSVSLLCLAVMVGCNQVTSQQPFYFFEDGDLSHYLDKATAIDVPDVDVPPLADVEHASAPLSLSNADNVEIWNLSLEEAMQIGLQNSRVMKQLGATLASPEALTSSPDIVRTMYDPALTETDPRYGVEAALSAFDAMFQSNVGWEKVDRPSNVGGIIGNNFFVKENNQDLGSFSAAISKYNATGGWSSIGTNAGYNYTKYSRTRQWATDWNVDVTAEFRQPLFQGNGVQFNQIAGIGAIPGFYNGPIIARIREDISLADFEASVKQFVADLETAYWELYLAYRELDSVAAGYHSALETWKQTYAKAMASVRGGEAEREAQAREQVYL